MVGKVSWFVGKNSGVQAIIVKSRGVDAKRSPEHLNTARLVHGLSACPQRKSDPVNSISCSRLTTTITVDFPLKPHTAIMAEQLVLRGTLEGHSGWVTSLATSLEKCV